MLIAVVVVVCWCLLFASCLYVVCLSLFGGDRRLLFVGCCRCLFFCIVVCRLLLFVPHVSLALLVVRRWLFIIVFFVCCSCVVVRCSLLLFVGDMYCLLWFGVLAFCSLCVARRVWFVVVCCCSLWLFVVVCYVVCSCMFLLFCSLLVICCFLCVV